MWIITLCQEKPVAVHRNEAETLDMENARVSLDWQRP